jgi:hypothetical protein
MISLNSVKLKMNHKPSLILQPHMCLTTDNAPHLRDPGFDNVLLGKGYCTLTEVYEVMQGWLVADGI